MISVAEAKKIISENVIEFTPVSMPLQEAALLTLGEDVYSPCDIPAFPQSSMDGYAFSFNDWQNHKTLKIAGEVVAAGSQENFILTPGNALRIFTGAPVPPGADTVVMQENAKNENGILLIMDEKLQVGNHVRPRGSEIKAGKLALESPDSGRSRPPDPSGGR